MSNMLSFLPAACFFLFHSLNETVHLELYRLANIKIYLKPLKTQLIKIMFFSFITKSHTLFMFKPVSLSHGNVKGNGVAAAS